VTPKVWVLGAGGMLGHALVRRLERAGLPHRAAGRELDITDAATLREAALRERPTHVINAAAFTRVDACEAEGFEGSPGWRANAEGPGAVAAAAAAAGATALHVSTDYVFDGRGRAPQREPYREEDETAPINAYGKSKRRGELAFAEAAGGAAYLVRTSWLYGREGASFPRTILRLAAEREELRVVNDQHGRPTWAEDLAAVLLALLGLEGGPPAAPGCYHVANAGETTWHGFAEAILEGARRRGLPVKATRVVPISTAEYPTPARRPAYSVLSLAKIERALAAPPRPWQAALADYLEGIPT
jgi:dTDP-4-dehydrorhamnose reductase